jgi:hypothetical protein
VFDADEDKVMNTHHQNALILDRIMREIRAEQDKERLREIALKLAATEYKRHRSELVHK